MSWSWLILAKTAPDLTSQQEVPEQTRGATLSKHGGLLAPATGQVFRLLLACFL